MRRGKPPERKTPLRAGTPLARSGKLKRGASQGYTGPWPSRSRPIKTKRDQPRRRNRRDPAHGLPWADVRLIIHVRAGGRCELCDRQLNVHNMEAHHRRSRAVGPDCPCNALALCSTCHHDDTHGQPVRARELGAIISRGFEGEPADVPVELHRGIVLLACNGTYLEVPAT